MVTESEGDTALAHRAKTYRNHPAKFFFLIKDHKAVDADGLWQIRPIASVHGSSVDKLDQLIESVIQLIARTLPFALVDTPDVLNRLHELNNLIHRGEYRGKKLIFASLDVVSLYPSISRQAALGYLLRLARLVYPEKDREYWAAVKEAMDLVMNEYTVEFAGKVFLQKRPCYGGEIRSPTRKYFYGFD